MSKRPSAPHRDKTELFDGASGSPTATAIKFLAASLITLLAVYLCLATLSVMAAHVIKVWSPRSGLAERLIQPVQAGLEFVDCHWKSVLILLAIPLAGPYAKEMLRRITRIGPVYLKDVPLELAEKGEKPREDPKSDSNQEARDGA